MKQSTEEHFASHWLTIQPSLFDFLEDEVGELDDNQRLFVRISDNHVPIIDANPRRGAPKPDGRGERAVGIAPAEKLRFRNRSGVERVNGHLHDAHGGRTVRVRGRAKVLLHLILGLLVIAVEQSAQML